MKQGYLHWQIQSWKGVCFVSQCCPDQHSLHSVLEKSTERWTAAAEIYPWCRDVLMCFVLISLDADDSLEPQANCSQMPFDFLLVEQRILSVSCLPFHGIAEMVQSELGYSSSSSVHPRQTPLHYSEPLWMTN